MNLERLFQILAVILIGVAAYFLWRGNNDALFVSGVLGAVCFFLSVRFQVKERMEQREAEARLLEEKFSESDSLLQDISADYATNDERLTGKEKQTENSL